MDMRELHFKKGEILGRPGDLTGCMYNVLYGTVGIYMGYDTDHRQEILQVREGDFLNVISFLESFPRNTTAVALEDTVVSVIDKENFSAYFRERPAKLMSLMQHMSGRIRFLQRAYLDTLDTMHKHLDQKSFAADAECCEKQGRIMKALLAVFPSMENM